MLGMAPAMCRMMYITRVSHRGRLIWHISTIRPIRSERPLIVRHSRCKLAERTRSHDSTKLLPVHLVRRLLWLQRRNLIEHGIDLGNMATCPSRSCLKVEAWAPLCRPLLFDVCIGTVDTGRPQGKILLHAVGDTRLSCDGQQDVLCGMRCAIVLDR